MGDTFMKVLIHKDVFDSLLRRRATSDKEQKQDQNMTGAGTSTVKHHDDNNSDYYINHSKSTDVYTKMELRFGADSTLRDVIDTISSRIVTSDGSTTSSSSIPMTDDNEKDNNIENNDRSLLLHSMVLTPPTTSTAATTTTTTITSTTTNSSNSRNHDALNGSPHSSSSSSQKVMLMDCTYHPPKEIVYSNTNNQMVGSNSITLYQLKWFPSATIVFLSRSNKVALQEIMTSKLSTMELGTFQDAKSTSSTAAMGITTPNNSKPLPSQVFQAVQSRFDNDNDNSQDTADPTVARKRLKDTLQEKEQRRCQRLDDMLSKLNSKSSKTSTKVREMLMKSRAKGEKRLRQEDRVYLQVVLLTETLEEDEGNTNSSQQQEDYIFVSQFAAIGKVMETTIQLMQPKLTKSMYQELLVKRHNQYWRLPNTFIVKDAIQHDYIKPFEQIIIRQVVSVKPSASSTNEWRSPCITEIQQEERITNDASTSSSSNQVNDDDDKNLEQTNANSTCMIVDDNDNNDKDAIDYHRYNDAIDQFLVSSSNKKSSKKSSASSQKVREMLIKSKALGDKKRIKDVSERLFLEVIVFDNDSKVVSIQPYFVSQSRDTLQKLLEQCCSPNKNCSNGYTLMVRRRNNDDKNVTPYTYVVLNNEGTDANKTTGTSFQSLLQSGEVKKFDQILIIPSSNKTSI